MLSCIIPKKGGNRTEMPSAEAISDLKVRLAQVGDIHAIQLTAAESWRAAYSHIFAPGFIAGFLNSAYAASALRAAITGSRSTFLVAERAGDIAGFAQYGDRGRGAELFRLYVHPRVWRHGIGRRLLSHVEMQFLVLGAARYYCTVHKHNDIGKLFYLKNGFSHIAARDSRDEWYMRKTLWMPEV